jgi:NADPH-dependent 7-cyano-7-deazaguanine reductase QueF
MESIRNHLNFVVYEQLVNCAKTKQPDQMTITIEQYMDHLVRDSTLVLANLAVRKV